MLILYFFVGYLRNVCFIIGSLSSASYMMKDININLLTELFSGNFNGNFIELKCTTLFFEGKTKQKKPEELFISFMLFVLMEMVELE